MENTQTVQSQSCNNPEERILIEKVHRCADCPIRRLATKQPQSVFARIHTWHKTWWPGWKAHRARVCAMTARAGTHG